MFEILAALPKQMAISIMHELYYTLQHSSRRELAIREGQLNDEEMIVFSEILKAIEPKTAHMEIDTLNRVFDFVMGFRQMPKEIGSNHASIDINRRFVRAKMAVRTQQPATPVAQPTPPEAETAIPSSRDRTTRTTDGMYD